MGCLLVFAAASAEAQRIVTSTADPGTAGDGLCTLREAFGNGGGGDCPGSRSEIHFNIPGTGPHVIRLNSSLDLSFTVTFDGSTQPGSEDVCTRPIPERPAYQIIIDGGGSVNTGFSSGNPGADGSTIRGLNIRNFTRSGIELQLLANVTVECNFIGTDETGTLDAGNGTYGVILTGRAAGNRVGGTDPGQGNLISGNGTNGIQFGTTEDSFIEGNYIGTDKSGTSPIPNGNGIELRSGAVRNFIGGTAAGAGNIIAFNQGRGIVTVDSSVSGFTALGNRFLRNSIFENGNLGIDLDRNGVTANDGNDSDVGTNRRMNFPEISAASLNRRNLSVDYRVTSSTSNQAYPLRVEFFYADADGQEGRTFLGSANYNSAGQTRTVTFSVPTFEARVLATATDADGNTSEFSPSRLIDDLPSDLFITKVADRDPAIPGGPLNYTIVASNAGPADRTDVAITDALPSALTCSYTSSSAGGASGNTAGGSGDLDDTVDMPIGSSITYRLSCVVDPNVGGTVRNTARIRTSDSEIDNSNNTVLEATPLVRTADVSVSITGPPGDLLGGGGAQYTVVAQNAGPSQDREVQITNTPPSDLSCTRTSVATGGATGNRNGSGDLSDRLNLPPGASVTYTLDCLVDAAASGDITQTVTLSPSAADPDTGNNSASVTNTAGTPILTVEKTGPAEVLPGATIQYLASVRNRSAVDIPSVTFTDIMPAELEGCTFTAETLGPPTVGFTPSGSGDINDTDLLMFPNSRLIYTITCTVPADASGTIRNTATAVWGGGTEPDTSDNSASVDTQVTRFDLATEVAGPTLRDPGEAMSYTLTLRNDSNAEARPVSFAHTPSAVLEGCTHTASATGAASGFTASGDGTLADAGIVMAAGSAVTYSVDCTVSLDAFGPIVSTAAATLVGGSEVDLTNNTATLSTAVENSVDLAITKRDDSDRVDVGGVLTYTLTVSNLSAIWDTAALVEDPVPTGLENCTWTSVASGGAVDNDSGTGPLVDTIGLPPGGQVVYTYACDVRVGAPDTLENVATVTTSRSDFNAGNDRAVLTTPVRRVADIEVTKSNGVDAVTAGDSTTWTLDIVNLGPSPSPQVDVTDRFPGAVSNCTWTSTASAGASGNSPSGAGDISEQLSLDGGARVTYTATCDIDPSATGTLTNELTTTSVLFDPRELNGEATDADPIVRSADLSVTKTNGTSASVPGGSTTYTVVVSNAGPSDDRRVRVTDAPPSELGCTWTSVAAGGATGNIGAGSGSLSDLVNVPLGASVTYTFVCDIDAGATGTLANTATVRGSFDDTAANDSATDTDTLVAEADIAVTKTNGGTSLVPGTSTTYTVVASNLGPSDDPSVRVVDTLSPALGCTWTSAAAGGASGSAGSGTGDLSETLDLPAGASVTYTLVCDIDAGATGTLSNSASVTGSFDGDAGNNSATDTDTLAGSADVGVTKTNGTTDSVPGTSTTYTVVASNAGPSDDPSVQVVDMPPSSLACTWTSAAAGGASGSAGSGSGGLSETLDLPAGASMTYTFVCDIDSGATGTISNAATVTGSFDGVAANDSATDTDTLTGSADVGVTKTNGTAESVPGAATTYTVVASNAGPSDDPGVQVVDVLPPELACTWTSAAAGGASGSAGSGTGDLSETLDLPAGASVTYTLVCDIDAGATGTLGNTATVTGSFDGADGNNSATDTDTLSQSADVGVTKTNGRTDSIPGTATTYTVVASNAGPSDDPNVQIVDALPPELSCTWTSAAAGGASGSAGSGSGDLSETLDLPAGASVTYSLSCGIDSAAAGSLGNTATVSGSFDSNAGNDSATDTDTLSSIADVGVTKTNGTTESVPGTSTTYT
ncbi:MAG: hypothetical protein AAGF23_07730, partial [Acidobacteriota bacterium]